MLRLATDPVGQAREQRFVVALRLALDQVPVKVVAPKAQGFAQLPLSQQTSQVGPLLARHRGLAITWIYQVAPTMVLLYVAVSKSGNALISQKKAVHPDPVRVTM